MKDKIVYLSHNRKNAKIMRAIASIMSRDNPRVCIINPKLTFPYLTGEEYIQNSLTLLDMCDEMWVVGDIEYCENYEINYCREHRIPIVRR